MPLIFDENQAVQPAPSSIKEGSLQSFKTDVVEESKQRIVLAYFYMPQNKQCVEFAAMLEKYVNLSAGKVSMVKFNAQDCQPLVMQLGIQTVPTTMIFAKGGLVDGFSGAISDSQLKTVMQTLIGKAALSLDEMLKSANAKLDAGDVDAALESFTAVLEKDAANPQAFAGMIRCFIRSGQLDAAKDLADGLEENVKSPELDAAKTALALALESKNAPKPDALAKKAAENPDDIQTQIDYANALFAAGDAAKAVDVLINAVAVDPDFNDGAAKQRLFKLFEALGATNPTTLAGRRRLSSLLFA